LLTAIELANVVASFSPISDVVPFGAIFGRVRVELEKRCPSGRHQMGESRTQETENSLHG
jgi:hypothetical protein